MGIGFGVMKMRSAVEPETTGPIPAMVSPDATATTTPSDHVTGNDSLQNLIAMGKTLECSFRTSDAAGATEGTAFFYNGKLRVDTMYAGTSSLADTSNLIISDDMIYTWAKTPAGSFAVKLPTSAIRADGAAHRDGEVSLQNNVQYDCKPWHVDGSVFVPPADITFMDMSNLLPGMPADLMPPQP